MKRTAIIVSIVLAAAACAYPETQDSALTASAFQPIGNAEHDMLTFVQAACGGCHAVEPPHLSPNPASPPFADIANRDGLTKDTLVRWLTDAHNYPEVMDFDLDPPQVEDVADYILTLRTPDYTRAKD